MTLGDTGRQHPMTDTWETQGHLQRDPCGRLRPHGHLQQNGGSKAQHTSERTRISENPVSHSQPPSWLLCLHIWGFGDRKMNIHPSFPYPSWGGQTEAPSSALHWRKTQVSVHPLPLLVQLEGSERPQICVSRAGEQGSSDKKGQAPSRLNMEVSDQKLTTRGVSLAATAMCPPLAHTHRDCLTLPGAHIGSPIHILAPWWTWVTPTRAQMQKQLWSQPDVPEAIIRTHPQLQALRPSHMWTLVCTYTPVRSRSRPQSPAPKWAWLRSGSRPGKRSGQPVAPQKGICSPRGSVGLVSPLLPPALPLHHLSLP